MVGRRTTCAQATLASRLSIPIMVRCGYHPSQAAAKIAMTDRAQRFPIRRFASFDAMKADEYQYWQSRPAHERLAATSQISTEAYRIKDATTNVSRLRRTLSHLKR
jgi:hypothetical protein